MRNHEARLRAHCKRVQRQMSRESFDSCDEHFVEHLIKTVRISGEKLDAITYLTLTWATDMPELLCEQISPKYRQMPIRKNAHDFTHEPVHKPW